MQCPNCGNTDLLPKFKCCPECGSPLPRASNIPKKEEEGEARKTEEQDKPVNNGSFGIGNGEDEGKLYLISHICRGVQAFEDFFKVKTACKHM